MEQQQKQQMESFFQRMELKDNHKAIFVKDDLEKSFVVLTKIPRIV